MTDEGGGELRHPVVPSPVEKAFSKADDPTDPVPLGEQEVVDVVWWRDPTVGTEVPKTYGLGWAQADGTQTGTLALPTPHSWLSTADAERSLAAVLAAALESPVALRAASEKEPNPVVRLARAGHRIVDVDLWTSYGLDVVGGVVAQLRGRGVTGVVVVEQHLSRVVRLSVAAWAERALDTFGHANDLALAEEGWEQLDPGRWQLLARQAGR